MDNRKTDTRVFSHLGDISARFTAAESLIVEIASMVDTDKRHYITHYLTGLAIGGRNWEEGPRDETLESLVLLRDTLQRGKFPGVEDEYAKLIRDKQWVPLWYATYHFLKRYANDVGEANVMGAVRQHTPHGNSRRPIMGYLNNPLLTVSPEMIKSIDDELQKMVVEHRHAADSEQLKKLGIPGTHDVATASEIMDIVDLVNRIEGNVVDDEVANFDNQQVLSAAVREWLDNVGDSMDSQRLDELEDFYNDLSTADTVIINTVHSDGSVSLWSVSPDETDD